MRINIKILVLVIFAVALAIVEFFYGPVRQPQAYHHFADQKIFLGINNFTNVVTNILFLIVGLAASYMLFPSKQLIIKFREPIERIPYLVFFIAVFLVSFGSGYYHLWPSDHTLVWDRLPISIAMTSFFSAIVTEFICKRWGLRLLPIFILYGLFSVIYWYWGVVAGADDMRFYLFVLIYPIIAIPLIMIMFKSPYTYTIWIWGAIALNILARVFEGYDRQIYALTQEMISGHSLKHLSLGFACLCIWFYLLFRESKN